VDHDDFVNCYFGRVRFAERAEEGRPTPPASESLRLGERARPYRFRHERKEPELFNPDQSGADRVYRNRSDQRVLQLG